MSDHTEFRDTQEDRAEHQMVEQSRRMRKRAEDAEREVERLQLIVGEAVRFLDARKRDGIEFPYESRPLRRLREVGPT